MHFRFHAVFLSYNGTAINTNNPIPPTIFQDEIIFMLREPKGTHGLTCWSDEDDAVPTWYHPYDNRKVQSLFTMQPTHTYFYQFFWRGTSRLMYEPGMPAASDHRYSNGLYTCRLDGSLEGSLAVGIYDRFSGTY